MKLIIKTIAFASLFTVSVASFAAEDADNTKKLNPWVDCGIGAMIFSNTKWAAVTSNIIWDLGITAVTSNISSQETCESSRAVAAARFITETYANLEEETVQGNGQHMAAMLNIMGCENVSHTNIITAVRADFGATVSQSDYMQKTALTKAKAYYNIVYSKTTGEFARSCQVI